MSDVYIWTHGGHRVSLTDPRPEQIRIDDIARALSRLNRWCGHVGARAYSVAQHSYYVSRLVPREFQRVALMHDAQEAYVGDVARPLKRLLGHNYEALERRFAGVIGDVVGLDLVNLPQCVRDADRLMQIAEARALLDVPRAELEAHFGEVPDTLPAIYPWDSEDARDMWLHCWEELNR